MQIAPSSFWMVVTDLEAWEGVEGSYVVGVDQHGAIIVAVLAHTEDPHNILVFDHFGAIAAGIVVSRMDITSIHDRLDYLNPDFEDKGEDE